MSVKLVSLAVSLVVGTGVSVASVSLASTISQSGQQLSNGPVTPPSDTDTLSRPGTVSFVPYEPEADKALFLQQGFVLVDQDVSPKGDQFVAIYRAPNGIPYVMRYSFCMEQGCLFLEAIAPVPSALLRSGLTSAEMNQFNRGNPVLTAVTEKNGSVSLRGKLPAREDCEDACKLSAFQIFFSGVNFAYEAFYSATRTVNAPETSQGVLDYAALGRNWVASPALVSAAFGDQDPLVAVRGYLTKEFGGGQFVPAIGTGTVSKPNNGFPALLTPAK
ncbi:MAG: hypothetical protein AAF986_06845 [Pseudomonadota bacterium]